MSALAWARALTLAAHLGLLALLVAWIAWLAPPQRLPVSLVLLLAAGPLLIPLRGLLHGRPRTHFLTGFLAAAYFAAGVTELWVGAAPRGLALTATVLALALFAGSQATVRLLARDRRP